MTNEAKNNVLVFNEAKSGSAWTYDQGGGLTYDGELDPISGMPVYYNGIGTNPIITNEAKNSVSVTNEAKNNI